MFLLVLSYLIDEKSGSFRKNNRSDINGSKGSLSISSENIFPIIKKWVYSDHDIFVREMVSNGCDAITKLKKLDVMGEYQLPDGYKPSIKVEVNPEEKTLKLPITVSV